MINENIVIIFLYRWSLIAKRLPGRTDNEIKNYWNTNLSKKLKKQPISSSSSWPSCSVSIQHNHHKYGNEKTKQIVHVAPQAPRPRRLIKVVEYNKILENNNSIGSECDQGSTEETSIADFFIDIDHHHQEELMVGDDGESNSKIQKMEDHKVIVSTNSHSSSSPSHHCHLLSEKFDPNLETLLDVELKKMASFLGLEN